MAKTPIIQAFTTGPKRGRLRSAPAILKEETLQSVSELVFGQDTYDWQEECFADRTETCKVKP